MFSPALASPFGRPQQFANAYKQVGVETGIAGASAHCLVQMLFDGLLDALTQARGALRSGQIETKGRAIGRAVRILDEGLKATLNLQEGGQLATDLHDLYAYTTLRLTQANLRNDERALDECQRLIQPLRDAWVSIAAQVDAQP
jgi:flagellar secretion chaperone FliS